MNGLRKAVRKAIRLGRMLSRAPGVFRHRGALVFHPGILVDQPGIAAAIDEATELALRRGVPGPMLPALLGRVVLIYSDRPIRIGAARVAHHASWRGGVFDRGLARICYDESWRNRTRLSLAALLIAEGRQETPDLSAEVA